MSENSILFAIMLSIISFWISVITPNFVYCIKLQILKAINLFTFTAHFGDENTCKSNFKSQRDKQGVVCKKCGGIHHYWKKDKWSYECKSCKFRTSLKSGTIMQHSNLSFLIWYRAMFLMSTTKKGFSAKEMQRQCRT